MRYLLAIILLGIVAGQVATTFTIRRIERDNTALRAEISRLRYAVVQIRSHAAQP